MKRNLLLSTRDILAIELNYIRENNISDSEIGNIVHFYEYYSAGMAVLVSRDDSDDFFSQQKNRKYVILKGSFARVLNNKVQAALAKEKIIESVKIDNKDYYKFIKNSVPLSMGNVMCALTVTNNPSPKPQTNYFAEDKRLQLKNDLSDKIIADGLSEKGFNIVVEKILNSVTNKDTKIIDLLINRMQELKEKKKHEYKYTNYDSHFTTADIYSSDVLVKARNKLKDAKRLLILGNSGDGKTQLAYFLAHEITGGEPIGIPQKNEPENYNRICIENAGNGYTLWEEDDTKETMGKLRLFVEHIEQNNITQDCCFICNEIQVSDLRFLVGGRIFEAFNNCEHCTLLPDNLYIIFTGCKDRDFGIDNQVLERIPSVEIPYIQENSYEVKGKILKAFKGKSEETTKEIIDNVGKINSAEECQIVSTRKLIDIINGKKVNLHTESILSEDGKKAYKKLETYL